MKCQDSVIESFFPNFGIMQKKNPARVEEKRSGEKLRGGMNFARSVSFLSRFLPRALIGKRCETKLVWKSVFFGLRRRGPKEEEERKKERERERKKRGFAEAVDGGLTKPAGSSLLGYSLTHSVTHSLSHSVSPGWAGLGSSMIRPFFPALCRPRLEPSAAVAENGFFSTAAKSSALPHLSLSLSLSLFLSLSLSPSRRVVFAGRSRVLRGSGPTRIEQRACCTAAGLGAGRPAGSQADDRERGRELATGNRSPIRRWSGDARARGHNCSVKK